MTTKYDALVVGAGHGGVTVITELVNRGFGGTLAVIERDAEPAYHRPPLSKGFLTGESTRESLALRAPDFWLRDEIELIAPETVVEIDAERRTVTTSGGSTIGYGDLVWAAGGHARRPALPGHELDGVLTLRTLSDAALLRASLSNGRRIVVMGGGYLGLEIAAVARSLGANVTIVEAAERLLSRSASEVVSTFFTDLHRNEGVVIHLGAAVDAIGGRDGKVESVRLANGEELPADYVVMAVGLASNVAPLVRIGLSREEGVHVDERCLTADPHIFAIGDASLTRTLASDGSAAWVRLESVNNAVEQGIVVASQIADPSSVNTYEPLPLFWSNQFDAKLKSVGLQLASDTPVVRGEPSTARFSVAHVRDGKLVCLEAINSIRDYASARTIIGSDVDLEVLADPERRLTDSVL